MENNVPDLTGLLCGGVFILIFAAAGVFMIVSNLRARKKAEASQSWPTTQGQVTFTNVVEKTRTDSDGDTSTSYEPVIKYSYVAAGQEYTSDKVSFGFRQGYNSYGKAYRALGSYSAGVPVTVYYDPANPTDAVLERKVGSKMLTLVLGIIFLIISICLGFPLLVYNARSFFQW